MAPGVSTIFFLLAFISSFSPIRAAPTPIPRTELVMRQDSNSTTNSTSSDFKTQNALDAQKLNAQFATIKVGDACQDGSQACVNSAFAQCVSGTWALSPCASGTTCVALPLVNKAGTSLSCDTESDAESRFSAAGVSGGITGSGNTTTSTGAVGNSTTTDDDDDSDDCDDGDDSSNDTVSAMDGDGEDCDDEDDTATSTASAVSKTVSTFATSTSTISSSISSVGTAIGDQVTATTILLNFPSVSSDASAASTITLKLSSASISASVASDAAVAAATTIKLNRLQRQLTFISSAAAAPTPASESVPLPSSVLPPGIGSVSLTTISLVGSVASAVSSDTVPSAIPSLSASPFGSSPAAVVSSPAAVSSESPSSVGVLPFTVTVTVVSTVTVAVPAATISSSASPGVLPSPSISESISASVLPSNPISNAPVLASHTVSVLSVPLSTVVSEPISATSFLPSVSAASVLASQTASVATNPFSVSAPALSSESATLSQALTSPAVSTILPIASVNTLISTSTSVSVTPSATAAGFSFSLQPTAASSLAGNNVNIGQVTSVDIATLLTATIA